MKILFLHNNFPGQFRRIYQYLKQKKSVQMATATLESNESKLTIPRLNYKPHREVGPNIHPLLYTTEEAVLYGQAAFEAMSRVRKTFKPDLICGHVGTGPMHLAKECWPEARMLGVCEWFYHARGSDVDFSGEPSVNTAARAHFRNLPVLIDLASLDWGYCATDWQYRQFPEHLRHNLSVMHEGVDVEFFRPGKDSFTFGDRVFTAEDEIVTYTTRGLDPYRGFPQFMEAVARLQKKRPSLQVLIAGNEHASYGQDRADRRTHKQAALESLDLDLSRIHFLHLVPLEQLRALFRITRAHCYATYPFVLSWSMIEAMATGVPLVSSRTPPVEEVVTHEENGLLAGFYDIDEQVAQIERMLDDPDLRERLGKAARQTALERYDMRKILPRQWKMMQQVARGERPG